MDDTTTDEAADHALTRRAALAAGAAGAAGLVLTSQVDAATKASAQRYGKNVIVHAPKEVVFDLEKVRLIQEDILGQLGCRACCSGFDFHFPTEIEFVVPRFDALGQEVSPQQIVDAVGEV